MCWWVLLHLPFATEQQCWSKRTSQPSITVWEWSCRCLLLVAHGYCSAVKGPRPRRVIGPRPGQCLCVSVTSRHVTWAAVSYWRAWRVRPGAACWGCWVEMLASPSWWYISLQMQSKRKMKKKKPSKVPIGLWSSKRAQNMIPHRSAYWGNTTSSWPSRSTFCWIVLLSRKWQHAKWIRSSFTVFRSNHSFLGHEIGWSIDQWRGLSAGRGWDNNSDDYIWRRLRRHQQDSKKTGRSAGLQGAQNTHKKPRLSPEWPIWWVSSW